MFTEVKKSAVHQLAPSHWEKIRSIVDSGATVPVMNPATGQAYPMTAGAAAKAGVMYQVATGVEIPNLGEKSMAVMTPEGEIMCYESQCADVTSTLNAVRSMIKHKKMVIFDDEGCYVINKITGTVSNIDDDGINYTMDSYVIPPDQLDDVMAMTASSSFRGQAR